MSAASGRYGTPVHSKSSRERAELLLSIEAVAQRSVRAGSDHPGMAQNFIACDREQELLLPPSLRDWLPEDHLA
jgi:hypothetical protein